MEKMIKVINDNLRNVINGIKEHRADLEGLLDGIRNDMTAKVKEANNYKSEVENARAIVYSLENEISDLENDLQELNEKFGAKDFKEILAAGNKEINAKITEKRSLINEQGRIILSLTEKARSLKETLVELRENKLTTEDNLNKTKILEGYFELRINEIINFSEEHPEELATYRDEIPTDELDIQEDIDVTSVIDGSIFEEIDELSYGQPNNELLANVLANAADMEVEVTEDVPEEPPVAIEIAAADQLDAMINQADIFVNGPKEEKNEEVVEETPQEIQEEEIIEPTVIEEPQEIEEINPFLAVEGIEEEIEAAEEEEKEEEVIELVIEEDLDQEPVIFEAELEDDKDDDDDDNSNMSKKLEDAGLDPVLFGIADLTKLRKSVNKDNLDSFVGVMKKHNINVDRVYDNTDVLVNVSTEDLDNLLSLAEKCDATTEDIDLTFKYFDKVNIDKFEQVVNTSSDLSLTSCLSEAIDEEEDVIGGVLGLSKKAEETLKKNATKEELKIMNTLPEIVLENYNEVKALNVNNLEECITKYPHRFTLARSEFHDILDKYDREDLIRCINKNAAVIDKL